MRDATSARLRSRDARRAARRRRRRGCATARHPGDPRVALRAGGFRAGSRQPRRGCSGRPASRGAALRARAEAPGGGDHDRRPRRRRARARHPRPQIRPRGVRARGRLGRADRGAHERRRVLRDAHGAPAAARRSRPHHGRHRAGLAALSRARADARQRPPLLHAGVDRASDQAARLPQAQPAPPALLGQPGLSDREREPPRDRVGAPPDQAPGAHAAGAREALPRAGHPGARHAGASRRRARATPRAAGARPPGPARHHRAGRPTVRGRPDPRVPGPVRRPLVARGR